MTGSRQSWAYRYSMMYIADLSRRLVAASAVAEHLETRKMALKAHASNAITLPSEAQKYTSYRLNQILLKC